MKTFRMSTILMSLAFIGMTLAPLSADVKIEIKIGTGIEKMNPVGVNTEFASKVSQLVGWTRVKGATQPMNIVHEWVHEGKVVSIVPLKVKSSYFRTWSRKALFGLSGQWEFRVKDDLGNVLATQSFTIKS